MGAVVPELDHVRHNPIARPVRWPGHGLAFEPLSLLLEPALEQSAGRKRARLVRRPCAQLRITGTAGEICVGFLRAYGFDADRKINRLNTRHYSDYRITSPS